MAKQPWIDTATTMLEMGMPTRHRREDDLWHLFRSSGPGRSMAPSIAPLLTSNPIGLREGSGWDARAIAASPRGRREELEQQRISIRLFRHSHSPIHPSNHPSLPRLREARGSVRACCLPSSFLWPVLVRVPSLIVGGGRGGQRQRCQHEECVCTRPHPSFVHRARPVASPFPLLPPPCCLRLVPRRVRPSRHPAPALGHRAGVGFTNGETSHSRARMACVECCGRTQK